MYYYGADIKYISPNNPKDALSSAPRTLHIVVIQHFKLAVAHGILQ